ncbi:MAG TPA: hypothetical protein VM103_01645 [Candidatus Paceibacterota bacterium]|nr:hypothetical protein [Candidatus Paceibacterota bacterium]
MGRRETGFPPERGRNKGKKLSDKEKLVQAELADAVARTPARRRAPEIGPVRDAIPPSQNEPKLPSIAELESAKLPPLPDFSTLVPDVAPTFETASTPEEGLQQKQKPVLTNPENLSPEARESFERLTETDPILADRIKRFPFISDRGVEHVLRWLDQGKRTPKPSRRDQSPSPKRLAPQIEQIPVPTPVEENALTLGTEVDDSHIRSPYTQATGASRRMQADMNTLATPESASLSHEGEKTPLEQKEHLKNLLEALTEITERVGATSEHLATPVPSIQEEIPVSSSTHSVAEEDLKRWMTAYPETPTSTATTATPALESVPNTPRESARGKEYWEKAAPVLAEKAGLQKERENLLAMEREYLDAEHAFYAKKGNGIVERAAKRLLGTKEYTETVGSSYTRYNIAATEFEKKLETRLQERLLMSTKDMEVNEAKEYAEKFAKRYRRMVVSKDTIDHGEERLKATREQALNEQGKNTLEKGLMWAARQNQKLEDKFGKQPARAIRIIGIAAAAGVATVALTPASAVLGLSVFGTRIVRGFVGTFGGALAGAGAGKIYEKTEGAYAKGKLVEARENAALDTASMLKRRDAYRKGSAAAVEGNRKRIEMITAALVGAGLSMQTGEALAHNAAIQNAADTLSHNDFIEKNAKLLKEVMGDKTHFGLIHEQGATPAVPAEQGVHAPPAAAADPTVEVTKGHGYEFMAKDLRTALLTTGKSATDYPEGSDARSLLEAKTDAKVWAIAHRIAEEHGFARGNATLVPVFEHSTMRADAQGHLLFNQGGISHADAEAPAHPRTHVAHIPLPKTEAAPQTKVVERDYGFSTHQERIPIDAPDTSQAHPVSPIESTPVASDVPEVHTDATRTAEAAVPNHSAESMKTIEVTPAAAPSVSEYLLAHSKESHIYSNGAADLDKRLYVYGGSVNEQADKIEAYLKAHKDSVVYGTDESGKYRVPYYMSLDGKVVAAMPERTSGVFGFFSTWKPAPGPKELVSVVE